ncbi:MAG: hypothetical protein Q8N04_13360 [Nitrospira sp.]|nr:hypothetical protein [Nitrospira sp.]
MTDSTTRTGNTQTPFTLTYGMRLDPGTGAEEAHPHMPIVLPDGSTGNITLHVINGTPEEIKARLLECVDAFFEIHAET